uniref:Uncharacterized protein n=1 Tax=Pseudonaja textilis TaxID=8673 RepID=A0A670ZIX6_PSETE
MGYKLSFYVAYLPGGQSFPQYFVLLLKNGERGLEVAPVYDDVSEFPVYATVSKPKNMKPDESSVHYADIQVFTKPRERSAGEVKNLQTQNATEYATLNFSRAPLKYDNKNGTLV